ncbi:MAG: hypothetical protein U5R31_01465 [Acidimicrobiia bacterium]|nr:hypothetical protein [Acidimicrobiia bacterium]
MEREDFETAGVVHELIDELGELDRKFFEGDAALADQESVLEGYRWIFTILQVAMDVNVWADPANPRFVDIVGPYEKWGGDNADASYQYAPVDPARTYRVRGVPGDAVYLSITVYGGPDDGRYSERIVGCRRPTAESPTPAASRSGQPPEHRPARARRRASGHGSASSPTPWRSSPVTTSPNPPPDARATWTIEAVDDDAGRTWRPHRRGREPLRSGSGAALDLAAASRPTMVPLPLGRARTPCDEPYPVPSGDVRLGRRRRRLRHGSPTSSDRTRRWWSRAVHPSARSGTCACGTRSSTPTTTTTSG